MRAVDYAAAAASPGSEAQRRLRAGLAKRGLTGLRISTNPTSGRDDGVTPTPTPVVICGDETGQRVCVKFYEETDEARLQMQEHAKSLQVLRGVIPVPDTLAVELDAAVFGMPALVTSYIGEPLDGAISDIRGADRQKLVLEIGGALLALVGLDVRSTGLRAVSRHEMRGRVAKVFADDAEWYRAHAEQVPQCLRALFLTGSEILGSADVCVRSVCLAHRDLTAPNITVRGRAFSGLVDWDHAGLGPPEQDLGSCVTGFLVTLPIPKPERAQMVGMLRDSYRVSARSLSAESWRMALLFALDALLDWVAGGKNAPMVELAWATSGIVRAIEEEAPLREVLC